MTDLAERLISMMQRTRSEPRTEMPLIACHDRMQPDRGRQAVSKLFPVLHLSLGLGHRRTV